MPKLSIIVPVYNVEKYLVECVESILNQKYRNFELILVDDGSTDNSGTLCDEYAKKYDFIVVIHKINGGLSSARNAGIEIARGEALGFVDSDDWIHQDMYAILMEDFCQNDADVSCCNHYNAYENGTINIGHSDYPIFSVYNDNEVLTLLHTDFAAWNKVYKKNLFQTIRFPEGKLYEDARTTYKIMAEAKKATVRNTPLYYYRHRSNSIMTTFTTKNYLDRVQVWDEISSFLEGKVSPEVLRNCANKKSRLSLELIQTIISNKSVFKNKNIVGTLSRNISRSVLKDKFFTNREKLVSIWALTIGRMVGEKDDA